MPTLTKARLAAALREGGGVRLARRDAAEFVGRFFDTIADALENDQDVLLGGFGRFRLLDKSERPARNPRTGKPASVSARRVVSFRSAAGLKARVQCTAERNSARKARERAADRTE